MNRRTLKKHSRRAMLILIEKHGYSVGDFHPSDGQEAMDAPVAMEARFVRDGFLEPGPLKGTPLLWRQTSTMYDEWESQLPSEWLHDLEFWEAMSDEEFGRIAGRKVA